MVSPKYDSLLQTIKLPSGPVINAKPIPAAKALTIKSSNIISLSLSHLCSHQVSVRDRGHVDKKLRWDQYSFQII